MPGVCRMALYLPCGWGPQASPPKPSLSKENLCRRRGKLAPRSKFIILRRKLLREVVSILAVVEYTRSSE